MNRLLILVPALMIFVLFTSCSSTARKTPNRYKKYTIYDTGQLSGQWEVRNTSRNTTIAFDR